MPTLLRDPHLFPTMAPGPVAGLVHPYEARLAAEGYTPKTAKLFFWFLQDLNRWLLGHRYGLAHLSEPILQQFLKSRHRRLRPWRSEGSAVRKLTELLREQHLWPGIVAPLLDDPCRKVVEEFDRYLLEKRGLADTTRHYYCRFTYLFLQARFGTKPVRLAAIRAEDATSFIRKEALHMLSKPAGQIVTALRVFFRYLRQRGEIPRDLAAAILSIAKWQLDTVPRFLEVEQVERVLQSCDRRTAHGRRDYAILLLLARLGLRGGEVAGLTLDDLHWQTGQVTIRGKGNRTSELPLPPDVGEAIALYLQKGRAACSSRRVFLCMRAPRRPFANTVGISSLVAQRLKAAGIACPYRGAHLFRHSLATQMLRQGGSLSEIAQLLRHRSFNTTMIYAKVDVEALRTLAMPWPGRGGKP